MAAPAERIVEVRLILIVLIDITHPEFVEELSHSHSPSSIQLVVASEVVSNLESVGYVDSVIVSSL